MHNIELILTLTTGLAAALVLGYLAHLLGLSPMVGYLLAGVAVGHHTPGFVVNRELAEQLAEIGIILLMFGVGLHFHLKELLAVRRIAVPGAIGQSLVATVTGALVVQAFGWGWSAGIVFGLAISVASTVVLVRVLLDNGDLHTPVGHIAVGWLVVEDLFTVLVLVLLPAVFGGREASWPEIIVALGVTATKITALVGLTFLLGGRLIPWLLEQVAATRSRELFTLTVLVVALGIAVGSATVFGVSMALGAFLAGMIVGRSEFSLRAATEALPMRDAFAVLFFVSVGMLFEPQHLIDAPLQIVATLAIIMVCKPLAALAIMLVGGYPLRVALAVAVALAQIGEFSFILAALGTELEILPDDANSSLVIAAIISISLNPILYRLIDPFDIWIWRGTRFVSRFTGASSRNARPLISDQKPADRRRRAVIVGYGPVGRTVARLLRQYEVEPTVVELNLEMVRVLRGHGLAAIYGDASHRDILEAAGMAEAGALILSSAGMHGSQEIIRQARDLNPNIRVLARTAYLHEIPPLRAAGAEMVFSAEGEIALAFTEVVLQMLGATTDEIVRQREHVRAELLEVPAGQLNHNHPPAPATRHGTNQPKRGILAMDEAGTIDGGDDST